MLILCALASTLASTPWPLPLNLTLMGDATSVASILPSFIFTLNMLSARSGLSSFGPRVPQRGLPVGREPRRPRIRPEWEQPASELGSSLPAVTPVDWPATGSEPGHTGQSVPAARGLPVGRTRLDETFP